MEYHVRLHLASAAIVITLGIVVSLITSTAIASRAYRDRGRQATQDQQTITVKGSTRQRIVSDSAVWTIAVSGRGKTLPDAYEALAAGSGRVRSFLHDAGFSDAEIGEAAIDTSTHYNRDPEGNLTREVAEYTLERRFIVTTPDVQRVHQSAGRVTELIREGVLVNSRAPDYYYSDLAQLRVDLMAAASADARARAEQIASNTGCRLGVLRSAHMGVIQITEPLSTEVSGYGLYDTSTIEKDVRAVVTATFGIDAG
jgi:uncharacterized protein